MSSYKNRPKRQSPNIAMKAKSELVSANLEPPAGNIFASWWKVLTRPSVATFASELPAARWTTTFLGALLYVLAHSIILIVGVALKGTSPFDRIGAILELTAINIIGAILGLFLISGVIYLLSKTSEGSGDFTTQTYLYSLYLFPLTIASDLLGLIPGWGNTIATIAVGIYELFLTYYMVQAAHRLTPGDAFRVVLLTLVVQIVLVLVLAFTIIAAVISSIHLGI